jgi:hypothetical protein
MCRASVLARRAPGGFPLLRGRPVYDPSDFAQQRRSANRFVIGVGLLALGGAGVFLFFGWKEIQEARRGPTPVTADQLKAAQALKDLPAEWVTLTPTGAKDTGVRRHYATRNGPRSPPRSTPWCNSTTVT